MLFSRVPNHNMYHIVKNIGCQLHSQLNRQVKASVSKKDLQGFVPPKDSFFVSQDADEFMKFSCLV